jgi:hypothetical protein
MPTQNHSSKRDRITGLTSIETQVLALYDGGVMPAVQMAKIINCTPETISNVLRRPHIIEALQDRSVTEKLAPLIASRQELQIYWTETLRDANRTDKDRLKASELLGKSFAMFTEKIEQKTVMSFEDALKELDAQGEDYNDL